MQLVNSLTAQRLLDIDMIYRRGRCIFLYAAPPSLKKKVSFVVVTVIKHIDTLKYNDTYYLQCRRCERFHVCQNFDVGR